MTIYQDKTQPTDYETLFRDPNRWIDVRKTQDWYVYTHSPRSGGQGVAILPYRRNRNNNLMGVIEFLGRFEVVPPHGPHATLCSITGMVDKPGKSIEQIVLEELHEEGGYLAEEHHLTNLGILRPNKSSDSIQNLFAINIDQEGIQAVTATTDGTQGEQGAYCDWVSFWDVVSCKDPLMHAMMLRNSHLPSIR
jgi:hypothetical protein